MSTSLTRSEPASADADWVFEAAPEQLELKQQIFAEVDRAAPRDAILASNTSVIPIGQIMSSVERKHRALGTHWWNPPYLVPLVEVVRTAETSDAAVAATMELLKSVGKAPVEVKKDVPGFVGNRLQHALWREAIALVAEGVCDAKTVDDVVKSSFGARLAVLGPLENADLVGTELTRSIHSYVLPALDRSTTPSPYLDRLIEEGRLGFKSGSRVSQMDARATGGLARARNETSQGELRRAGLDRGVTTLATTKSDKVIITCAVTGGIHTPTMSDALPFTPGRHCGAVDRSRGSGRLDPASARA